MTSARARTAVLSSLFLLVALVLTALPATSSHAATTAGTGSAPAAAHAVAPVVSGAASPAALSAGAADPAHPYSDPVWFPLRDTARVGCVYSNCPGPYHGYWAIDFGGSLDDPIYAAGAGVFHIGEVDHSCPTSGTTPGTWVWIDHGPAGITRYHHLNRILATEGQLVTPATEIGTMGNNGNVAPCNVSYLHMEWRAIGTSTIRLPIPTMKACDSSGQPLSFPTDLGYSAWNSIPNNQVQTGALTGGCQPSSWSLTPDRPTINVNRGSKSAVVIPSARPAGTDRWRDKVEEYFPSLKSYRMIGYHDHYPTTSSTTLTGLTDGRSYRITAAFHNATGWSAWASSVVVIPGSPPSIPVYRSLTHGSNWATLSWYRSSSVGSTATYQVARRCYFSGAWHAFVYSTVPGTSLSYEWHPIAPKMLCQVTVRAHNAIGWSRFQTPHYVTTS